MKSLLSVILLSVILLTTVFFSFQSFSKGAEEEVVESIDSESGAAFGDASAEEDRQQDDSDLMIEDNTQDTDDTDDDDSSDNASTSTDSEDAEDNITPIG